MREYARRPTHNPRPRARGNPTGDSDALTWECPGVRSAYMTTPDTGQGPLAVEVPAELIQAVEDTQAVVDQLAQQIAAAESELAGGDAALDELARRVEAGEDVAPDSIPQQRQQLDHVQLQLNGLRRRYDTAHTAARLARLQVLRAEIEGDATTGQAELAQLYLDAQTAIAAFLIALHTRSQRLRGWSQQLHAEGVPPWRHPIPEPPAAHAGLAVDTHSIAAGALRLHISNDTSKATSQALAELGLWLSTGEVGEPQPLRQLTTTAPTPDPELRFFHHIPNNTINTWRGAPPDSWSTDLRDGTVVEVSYAQAAAFWHRGATTPSGSGQ